MPKWCLNERTTEIRGRREMRKEKKIKEFRRREEELRKRREF